MVKEKPIIFISHINEEGEVAIKLKSDILSYYRGSVTVFVSSDFESIEGGRDYFNTIIDKLRKCILMITLCSPESVKREWINFETGFGYAREINVIPLLYRGLEFSDIHSPIQRMHGYKISDASLNNILSIIDEKLELNNVHYDFNEFISFAANYEIDDNTYKLNKFITEFEKVIGKENIKNTLLYDKDDERSMVNTTNRKYQQLEEILFEFDYEEEIKLVFRGGERRNSGFEKNGFNITYSEQMRKVLTERYLLDN